MQAEFDLFTKIFLDTDVEKAFIIETVSKIVKGTVDGSNILTEQTDIYIFNNGDFAEDKRNQGDDEFLYYKYYFEIEPTEDTIDSSFILEISNLLTALWEAGYKAVAACNFEELLPRKGGYNF